MSNEFRLLVQLYKETVCEFVCSPVRFSFCFMPSKQNNMQVCGGLVVFVQMGRRDRERGGERAQ